VDRKEKVLHAGKIQILQVEMVNSEGVPPTGAPFFFLVSQAKGEAYQDYVF
jgi:hypothetical protein